MRLRASLCLLALASVTFAADGIRLLKSPAVRNDTLVFRYAGDLWVSKLNSSEPARRLTSHPNSELYPKISPDGKLVAFNASYDGAGDIYVVSIEGGEPKRMTYDGGMSMILGWTPDGRIAYSSRLGNFTTRQGRLNFIRPEGGIGQPTAVTECTDGSFTADGQTFVYMRSYPGNWRRYRGGVHGRISLYNLATNAYSELPQKGEQNYFPRVVGRSIYYVSDRNDPVLNLYRYDQDSKKTTQVTKFTDADMRFLDTDGKTIVWERDGYIEALDIASGKVTRQNPEVLAERVSTRPTLKPLAGYMTALDLSPSASRVAVEARGEIFSVPTKAGDTINLTLTSGVREMSPSVSPDGKSVAYLSDVTGEYEIYTRPLNGGEPTQVTRENGRTRLTYIGWSPDGRYLQAWALSNDIYIVDLATGQLKHVANQNSTLLPTDWSPDSKWIAVIQQGASQMRSLCLYEVATGKLHRIGDGYYNDNSVAFDRNGKYIYVRSSRTFSPTFGTFEYNFSVTNTDRLYVVPLTNDLPNPLREATDDEIKPEPRKEVRIDLQGLDKRFIPLPMAPGNPVDITGLRDGVLFVTTSPGTPGVTITKFDLNTREMQKVYTGSGGSLAFNADRSKLALLAGESIRVMDVRPNGGDSATTVNVSGVEAVIDPREEWRQIFWDAWRFERDEFWDPKMRGLDWQAIGKQYEQYLPWVAHRADLQTLISMMINELGTSHAYVGDGDMGPQVPSTSMGYLGADYVAEGDYVKLAKVYHGEPFEEIRRGPLGEPGFKVEAGNYLLEIDGRRVTPKTHPHSLLIGKANRYVVLTVNTSPSLEGARKVRVRTVGSEENLRYYEWAENARRYVAQQSGGRIGYVHVPSVLHNGAADFIRGFYGQGDKDALIVDERWNIGGFFIQQLIVEMLNRKPVLGTQFRNLPDGTSIRAIDGPKVMLINEYAGSGGDSFPWTFRAGGAGKLIGRRTMGALVGINNQLTLIDGGYVTAPDMGVYDPKTGILAAENYGVAPDIEVDMRPDLVAQGKDPQLDAAIKHLLEELRKRPAKQKRTELPKPIGTKG